VIQKACISHDESALLPFLCAPAYVRKLDYGAKRITSNSAEVTWTPEPHRGVIPVRPLLRAKTTPSCGTPSAQFNIVSIAFCVVPRSSVKRSSFSLGSVLQLVTFTQRHRHLGGGVKFRSRGLWQSNKSGNKDVMLLRTKCWSYASTVTEICRDLDRMFRLNC
jgi:hypothetical protein